MTNHCGSCNACCRVYAIPEFKKPAGEWCSHCEIGKSCLIYETRPERCVDFKCMWLASQTKGEFEPDLRPDRCKCVFAPTTNPRVIQLTTLPGYPFAWQAPKVMAVIHNLTQNNFAVAINQANAPENILIDKYGKRIIKMSEPDADGMQWGNDDGSSHRPYGSG